MPSFKQSAECFASSWKWTTIQPDDLSCSFNVDPEELNLFLTEGNSDLQKARIPEEEVAEILISRVSTTDECSQSIDKTPKSGDLSGQPVCVSEPQCREK